MDQNPSKTPNLSPDLGWNSDPEWVNYVLSLTPVIENIAIKYTDDEALREDAVQNAHIELLQKYPEEVRGYEQYHRGEISFERWQKILRSYCLTVCRNEILTTLHSHATGNLYVGRTHISKVKTRDGTQKKVKTHVPARFASLDQLVEESGLQVSDRGELSWDSLQETGYGDFEDS